MGSQNLFTVKYEDDRISHTFHKVKQVSSAIFKGISAVSSATDFK